MRRAHKIWVALGVVTVLGLYTSFTSQLIQWPGIWTPARYLQPLDSNIITLTDGTFTYHLDRSAYDATFPYLQRYTCHEEIAQEGLCQGPPGAPLFLLAVKSHPASSDRRATLRRTWAQPREIGGFRLQPVFLMAMTPNVKHARLVRLESSTFGDVLMWDFMESHHNLSLKERCFLQWLHRHCPQVAYVFKGDDDLFVNPKGLTQYLAQTPNASRFIHGNIQNHSIVLRGGKYGVPQTLYPFGRYPNFASGGGFIMPGASIPALCAASLRLPVFPLDDVYLGFLALAAALPHQHDSRFRVWGVPKDELQAYRGSLTVHGVSMERMEQVWEAL